MAAASFVSNVDCGAYATAAKSTSAAAPFSKIR
jgi:hypothetical protein